MACIKCGNCEQDDLTYFCIDKNDIVIKENIENEVVEKPRVGWKKGDKEYETHRRNSRKIIEV